VTTAITPVILDRPREAHEIVKYLRERGWVYHPFDRMRWQNGNLAVRDATDALSLELGESRIEWRSTNASSRDQLG
jgi:hypothetical protein